MMTDYIYIGQTEDWGDFNIAKAFFTEEAALAWMRETYEDMKRETNFTDGDWDRFEEDVDTPYCDHKWACAAKDIPEGVRIFRLPLSAGDSHEIYVCQTTQDGCYPFVERAFFTEDEAREWIRKGFVRYRDENRLDNSRFYWNSTDGWWYCGDEVEHQDWEVFRLSLPE